MTKRPIKPPKPRGGPLQKWNVYLLRDSRIVQHIVEIESRTKPGKVLRDLRRALSGHFPGEWELFARPGEGNPALGVRVLKRDLRKAASKSKRRASAGKK